MGGGADGRGLFAEAREVLGVLLLGLFLALEVGFGLSFDKRSFFLRETVLLRNTLAHLEPEGIGSRSSLHPLKALLQEEGLAGLAVPEGLFLFEVVPGREQVVPEEGGGI